MNRRRRGCLIFGVIAASLFCAVSGLALTSFNAHYQPPDDVAEIARRRLPVLRRIARTSLGRCNEAAGSTFLEGPPSPVLDSEARSFDDLELVMIACYTHEGLEGEFAPYGSGDLANDGGTTMTLDGPLFDWDIYMNAADSHAFYKLSVLEGDDRFGIVIEEPSRDGQRWVELRATLVLPVRSSS